MRGVRATGELLLVLLIAWVSLASSDDGGGGGGGGDDDNGGGPNGTPRSCETTADCGGRPGDLCAGYDACVAGICVPQAAVTCGDGDDDEPCVARSCDPATGSCVSQPLADGSWCEDGDPCTNDTQCQAGRCVGGQGCDDGNPCTVDTCDPVTGCQVQPAAEGTPCTASDACVVDAVCQAGGVCQGENRDCADDNPCTNDWCDGDQGCVHDPVNDGYPCDDGNPCTGPDLCQGGQCANAPVEDGTACDDGNPCTGATVCQAGACSEGTPVGDGGACDDGDPCTEGTVCGEGECGGGTAVTCENDGNACTDDACVPGEGCVYGAVAAGSPCEPANPAAVSACVTAYACEGAQCLPGEVAPNGTPCDDGHPCTDGSICQAGSCAEGTPLGDGAACDDGDPCTEGSTCQGNACVGGAPVVCPGEQTLCANTYCDVEQGGCVTVAAGEGQPCDDGDPCTTDDVCVDTACVGEALCDDGDPCTTDVCAAEECTFQWQTGPDCPYEADCGDRVDNDGDGLLDCAVAFCARQDETCRTEQPIPSAISFDDGFVPGFGATYDAAATGHPRWQIDGSPADPGALSGTQSLNFNDGDQASWADGLTVDAITASLCCWQGDYAGEPLYVTWMEYVDLPTDEETATTDISILRAFRFVRHDGGDGTEATFDVSQADRGRWRRRVVENPAHDEIGRFGVEWSLSAPFAGFSGGAGWFVDDVEVLRGEICDNDADDNGNGAVDCDDGLCDGFPDCVEWSCADGIDDNGDGDTDCADQDCAREPECL